MRRLSMLLLLIALLSLSGCAGSRPGPEPAPPAQAAPEKGPEAAQPPVPAAPPEAEEPKEELPSLPEGACTPNASAAFLDPNYRGHGFTLKQPPVEPTPDRPWLQALSVGQIAPGGPVVGTTYAVRSGYAMVGTEESSLYLQLEPPAGLPQDWFDRHVQIEGVEPLTKEGPQFRIPAGRPGEAFRVTVTDVLRTDGTVGPVQVVFCRAELPTASLSYKDGDRWLPVGSEGLAPSEAEGPLTLRISFTAAMERPTVELALQQIAHYSRIDQLTWIDDRTLEVAVSKPGSLFYLNLEGARSLHGLYLAGGLPAVAAGKPGRLVAVDPSTGQRQELLELPPLIDHALLSPDGKQLQLSVIEPRLGAFPDGKRYLLDLTTGERRAIGSNRYLFWLSTGELAEWSSVDGRLSLTIHAADGPRRLAMDALPPHEGYELSPDGRLLYLLQRADTPPTSDYLYTYRFLILPFGESQGRLLPEPFQLSRPPKDGLELHDPVWSPDGSRIALTQVRDGGPVVIVADVKSGEFRTIAGGLEGIRGNNFDRIVWSPDSTRLLVGKAVLEAATGRVERQLTNPSGRATWSQDGQWLLESVGGDLQALHLPSGRSVALGRGLPAGWTPDGRLLLIENLRPFEWPAYNK
ncbi:MAG: TolB family protein [Bacillota bacterium]